MWQGLVLIVSVLLAVGLVSSSAHAQRPALELPMVSSPSVGGGGIQYVPGNIGLHGAPTPETRVGPMAPAGATPGAWAPAGATPGAWAPEGAPDGSRAGAPTHGVERDTAAGAERQADVYLRKRVFGNAADRLDRGVDVQKDASGAQHPDVADTLDRQAGAMRKAGRESGAVELEGRAAEVREKIEKAKSPSPTPGVSEIKRP
jgi:hypothetical protein